MDWSILNDTDRLQEATDKQIANAEVAIVLAGLALVSLVILSQIVIPAMSAGASQLEKSA
jgi:hypothetical protein